MKWGILIRRFPVDRVQPYRVCSDKCLVHLYQLRYLIFGNLISLSWSVKKQDALCFYRLSRHDGILDGNNTRDDDMI